MHATCNGIVGACTETSSNILEILSIFVFLFEEWGRALKSQHNSPPIDIANIMYQRSQTRHRRCRRDQIHRQVAHERVTFLRDA